MKTIIIDGIEYNLTPKVRFKKGDWVTYDGWHCQITEVREDGYCNSMNGFIPKEREDSMHLIITEPTPIFKIGDILKRKDKDYTFKVDRVQGGYYHCDRNHGAFFPIEEQDDWELYEPVSQKSTEWSEEDERRFNNLCFLINQSDGNVPTKEGFINWLKSFCHHKHNHTSWWYECIKECVGFKVGNVYNSDGEWIYGDNKKCAYDERFFHPQSHWKPSDEQIECLSKHIEYERRWTSSHALNVLSELLEQLKKLK